MSEQTTAVSPGPPPRYGERPAWRPAELRLRPARLLLRWLTSALALYVAALLLPGVHFPGGPLAPLLAAALIAVLNALLPPLIAAVRVPFTAVLGFIVALLLDAFIIQLAAAISLGSFEVVSYGQAFLLAVLVAGWTIVFEVILGTNDDQWYSLRVVQQIARRSRERTVTDVPGILYLEIDGLSLPVLQRAMRNGSAPTLASWVADGSHQLTPWETDLSSQTGASQAGLLLGANDDIPAFRWVEKATGKTMTCSSPPDCAEIERRHSRGDGLLAGGGASCGNLFSGDAEHVILTVSRLDAERRANPGYRAYLADGHNVSATFVLFLADLVLEWTATARARRRGVRPRGRRPLKYGFVRAGLTVVVRDLTVFSVLTHMMKGRPAIYACFAGYDEVAHHSGLERADTLEVLRKIDQQLGRIAAARRYAARPYEIVVLSDHGQTQGATFRQRNGYGLAEYVEGSLQAPVAHLAAGDENDHAVAQAFREATGVPRLRPVREAVGGAEVVVLASGNLGLIYLMDERRRLTREEIDARYPDLIPALRRHPDIGFLLVRSAGSGPLALGARGEQQLRSGAVIGEDPLLAFPATARQHLLRTDGFTHVADIVVNSSYDPSREEAYAFEELISFHGGLGGPQTAPFLLHPVSLPAPTTAIVGAEAAHQVLRGWRRRLQGGATPLPPPHRSGPTTPRSATPSGSPHAVA